MSEDTRIQRRSTQLIRENTQYALAFTVIAGMLLFTGLPLFVIFFFAVVSFFVWRSLASPSASGTREIFEFYLVANEMLRDDERRWYGFELQEAIARGENILRHMAGAPPLVSFATGALYHKLGDHEAAEKLLAFVVENDASDESRFVYPSPDLRSYVTTLRKIEREPAEAPLMSSAVRALERARRNRARTLLDASRAAIGRLAVETARIEEGTRVESVTAPGNRSVTELTPTLKEEFDNRVIENEAPKAKRSTRGRSKKSADQKSAPGQTISEILRDIYDSK